MASNCLHLGKVLLPLLLAISFVSHTSASDAPPINPYAGKSYGGCEGGFCPSADEALELEFWQAAERGDAKGVKMLLGNDKLNITRNIVPDSEGLSRVFDVAIWTASEKGRHAVMQVLLEHPGVKKMYEYEDGHILDMAAANGDAKMVQLLLDHNMTVGPSAMAHAVHFNHSKVMELLLEKPMDLKSAMQAISNGGDENTARLMLKATKKASEKEQATQSQGAYDWHGDYISIAVKSGNIPVLNVLLEDGYEIKWQQAQDFIKEAAEQGNPKVLDILLAQKLFKEDEEELDEAVDTALKTAAEMGQPVVIDLLVEKFPKQTKQHCKAGLFRAMKFGHPTVVERLAALCPVDVKKSTKLQEAEWLGKVIIAARDGDVAAIKELVKHGKATQRLTKLQAPVEEDAQQQKQKQPQGPSIHPQHNPLVLAAKNGHLDVVKELEQFGVLCPPCAAAEAAKKNQTAVIQHLAQGSGKALLQNFEDTIQDVLRVIAYSMEQHNWDIIAWLLKQHESPAMGPYFMPIIAQEGKLDDMRKMLKIVTDLGYDKSEYFKQQVYSALISAALSGHLELVQELYKHRQPLQEATAIRDDDYDDSSDKTEL